MQSKFNNLQSDWLNQAEELNDNEAAQVNGGAQISGAQELSKTQAQQNSDIQTQIMGLNAQATLYSAYTDAIQAESETVKQSP